MAELIKQQHELAVLHLTMDWSDRSAGGRVVFAVEIARSEVARFDVPVEALGLPANLRDARQSHYKDESFTVPSEVIGELRRILEALIA